MVARLALRALTERTRTELVAAGGRPRRLVLSGLGSLTPSERRVAQLAADGLSNRDIAQNLFITARTVEGHLTHACQKLAITSREQLPVALAPPRGRGTGIPLSAIVTIAGAGASGSTFSRFCSVVGWLASA